MKEYLLILTFVPHKLLGSKYTGHLKAFFVFILVCSFQSKLNILCHFPSVTSSAY